MSAHRQPGPLVALLLALLLVAAPDSPAHAAPTDTIRHFSPTPMSPPPAQTFALAGGAFSIAYDGDGGLRVLYTPPTASTAAASPTARRSPAPPGSSTPTATTSTLWASGSTAFLRLATGRWRIAGTEGNYDVEVESDTVCESTTLSIDALALAADKRSLCVAGVLGGGGSLRCRALHIPYNLTFYLDADHADQLLMAVNTTIAASAARAALHNHPTNSNVSELFRGSFRRLTLDTASAADEAVFGLGVQYTYLNLKGRVVPVLTTEQGVGRGLQPITNILNAAEHAGGNWHTTYSAVPRIVTSHLRSLALEDYEYAVFDLSKDSLLAIQLFADRLTLRLAASPSPLAAIQSYTAVVGRPQPLPDWITAGPLIGYEGGTAAVLALHEKIKAAGITPAGYWLQDWSGLRQTPFGTRLWWNWEVDDSLYPEWTQLCANMSAEGTRMLTYINPYLANTVSKDKPHFHHDYFQEAAALGFLINNDKGQPYIMSSASPEFTFGTIDLSNPLAVQWFANIIRENMLAQGTAGWMCDFGEYVPFDSVLSSGAPPTSFHNEFPYQWARTNRIAIDTINSSLGDPGVFFMRSSSMRSVGESTLFWLGDQLVTFDSFDGLRSAVIGTLSSGLSGYSLQHSDIGGYTMVDKYGVKYLRSKELLLRWMETSALSDVVFRSHLGNLPNESWQIFSDDDTLQCFSRMAKLHTLLTPYRRELMKNATAFGWPLARALWLHYPELPRVYDVVDEFLIGSEFLAAPVLDANASSVNVFLPPGPWVHLWSGAVHGSASSASHITVPAPFGEPPVFYRQGSAVGQEVASKLGPVRQIQCLGTPPHRVGA